MIGLSLKEINEVRRDEVKFLHDILNDNSLTNLSKETGYNIYFIYEVLKEYSK